MRIRLIVAMIAFGAFASSASAEQLLYTETFTASGTLDGVSFSGALVTLSLVGDTGNIVTGTTPAPGAFPEFTLGGTITIDVAGVGSDLIVPTTPATSGSAGSVGVYVTNIGQYQASTAGFFDSNDVADSVIIGTNETGSNTSFDNYSLGGPISVTDTAFAFNGSKNGFGTFTTYNGGTTGGSFSISSVDPNSTTFSAAVPEPSSFALMGIAGLISGIAAWRKKRNVVSTV